MRTLSKIIFIVCGFLCCLCVHAAPVNLPPSQIQLNNLSVEQLHEAAEAGDPDAQYALGYLYYNGKNVAEDKQAGLNWIKRASVQGQTEAIEAMRLLAPSSVLTKTATKISTTVSSEETEVVSNFSQAATKPSKTASVKQSPSTTKTPGMAILNAPSNYYTIQLLVTSNKAELDRYISTHALGEKANYYPTKKQGYVLLYGAYKTRAEAQASLLKLPAAVKAEKPWIKEVSQVKRSVG